MARLLDGIRVIDAANFIAGPVSTTIMADFGADVIKVEPPTGDVYRVRGAGYPPSPYNYPWVVDNRTKRSVAIDLRTGDGQDLLHRLVRDVDVFVTNAPLDSRARLRVRYEDLAPLNPRLIYASISAYGETGEEASKPGFDSIALWARTGLMDLVRASPDVPPARSLPGMGDHPTGTALFAAIMAGLYHRERTGRGTMVATSLMANGLWMNAIPVQGILCGARTEVRPPREEAISALANLYRCRDGRWFMLTITGDERHWESFVRGIGREDLLTDPRFAATHDRRTNARALTAILDAWFGTKDWAACRRSSRRPASRSALSPRSRTFGTMSRCERAALWCQSTTRGPAPRSPCRAHSRSAVKRRFHQHSRRRSGSTPSRCCAPQALPRRRSSDSCMPG